ncbi:MAG: hypothetical protein HOW97_41945 [Catenulispora sp.]|nr:hypothetical protein [Catenulispora sp.]
MSDQAENVTELLRAQRARLAGRLRAPWWYVAGSVAVMALAFAMPIGAHYLVGGAIWCVLLSIAAFLLLHYAMSRASGVDVGLQTWRFPSGRVWTLAMAAVILAATSGEALLLDHGLLGLAITVGAVAALTAAVCWQGHMRAVSRDLETGTAAR